jgi:hypothetical protein
MAVADYRMRIEYSPNWEDVWYFALHTSARTGMA